MFFLLCRGITTVVIVVVLVGTIFTSFLLALFLVYGSKTYSLGQLVHEMIVKHFQVRVLLCFLIHVIWIG